MILHVHPQELAVGGHDVGRQQAVDGESVLAEEEPDAASQGDPADPYRAAVVEAGSEAARPGRRRVLARGLSGLGPRGKSFGIDLQLPHVREVEHDPAVGDAVTRELWPPLRTASSRPVSRASATTRETSEASRTRMIMAGRRSMPP